MSELPILDVIETAESQFSKGTGGDTILVIGKTPNTKNLTKVLEFSEYAQAVKAVVDGGIGPEASNNPLLVAIKDIFSEASIRNVNDLLGIDKIYVVDIGSTPGPEDWLAAQTSTLGYPDIDIELYVGCSDLAVANSIKTNLNTMATKGKYRKAIFTNTANATVADIAAMTDSEQTSHIRSSRIIIKENPAMQAKFAAKMACTPYYQDPSYGPYRTATRDDIKIYTDAEYETLVGAGIIPDWPYRSPYDSDKTQVEPIRAVSTSFRKEAGVRPVDANVHIRRNVDYQWRQSDLIVAAHLKDNDAETTLTLIEESVKSFFAGEVRKGYLVPKTTAPVDQGFSAAIKSNPDDPYSLIFDRSVRPINAIYGVKEPSVIKAPTQ